jgi:hypothetical protein
MANRVEHVLIRLTDSPAWIPATMPVEGKRRLREWKDVTVLELRGRRYQIEETDPELIGTDLETLEVVVFDLE